MNASPKEVLLKIIKKLSYLLGPLLAVTVYTLTHQLEPQARIFLSIFCLVVFFWIFTDIPLFISGLFGVCASAIFGISTPAELFSPFADPIIFLFLSGFLLAQALEATQVDQWLATKVLNRPNIKNSPSKIILSFLGLSFFCSMWISNTAATAMLIPLAFGILNKLEHQFHFKDDKFTERFFLALAYTATLGGNVTPIGSPPNVVAIGHLNNLAGIEIGFLQWMALALPVSLAAFYLVYRQCINYLPKGLSQKTKGQIEKTPSLSNRQKSVLIIFLLIVFFWIFPSVATLIFPSTSKITIFAKKNLSASVIGLFFTSVLFVVPFYSSKKVLTKSHTSKLDWGSLLLFGTGLSLGKMLHHTGLSKIISSSLFSATSSAFAISIVLLVIFATIFFTELASNTASANIIIPIMIAFGQEAGLNLTVIGFCFALACNSAFMLPVATPPNVIVYGTNKIQKNQMIRTGFVLNLFCGAAIGLFFLIFSRL